MFLSKGEKKIAAFLDKYKIPYTYQPAIIVNDKGYQRIWYPDFGLNKYGLFIEYFGMINDPIYDQGTKHKLEIYKKSDISVIALYPQDLDGNYESDTFLKIIQIIYSRLSDLENRIIQTTNKKKKNITNYNMQSTILMKNNYL